jgi:hypothetical protein
MEEGYPPVRIVFGEDRVLVADGSAGAPALRISAPSRSWWRQCSAVCERPRPAWARRAGMFASRRVRIRGGLGLMRSFLSVIRL